MTSLPLEVWVKIFSYTSAKTVSESLALTCNHFREVSLDESLWRFFCHRVGISVREKTEDHDKGFKTWRDTFIDGCSRHNPPHTVWALLGSVNSGKSSLCGRLMCDTNLIDESRLARTKVEAIILGKASYAYSFLMNRRKDERERGVTLQTDYAFIEYLDYSVTLVDLPGHRDYMKVTCAGATLADYGLVVVSVGEDLRSAGCYLQQLILMAKSIGILKLVFAITRLDTHETKPKAKKVVYDDIVETIKALVRRQGLFKLDELRFVPIDSLLGDNLLPDASLPSTDRQWTVLIKDYYTGPTLWEIMSSFPAPPRKIYRPLRMTIARFINIRQTGLVVTGKILAGFIRVGDIVVLTPPLKGIEGVLTVKSIQKDDKTLTRAIAGDIVGVHLLLDGKNFRVKTMKPPYRGGMILSHAPEQPNQIVDRNPPEIFRLIECEVFVSQSKNGVKAGYCGLMICHTARIPVTIVAILNDNINNNTPNNNNNNNNTTNNNNNKVLLAKKKGVVLIRPWHGVRYDSSKSYWEKRKALFGPKANVKPKPDMADQGNHRGFCVDTFARCRPMGRFVIINSKGAFAMAGVIKNLNPTDT